MLQQRPMVATLVAIWCLVIPMTHGALNSGAAAPEAVASAKEDSLVMDQASEWTDTQQKVSRRVSEMIDGIRRLEYSYDFDGSCVSSFRDCVDDSNCDSDEECFFTSRRKRQLASKETKTNLRSLLFGTNNVGQCECL